MEGVGVTQFGNIYAGKRVLLTGHTGFKGSWLAFWLKQLGADVVGLALPPATTPSHWSLLGLDVPEYHQDIRDAGAVAAIVKDVSPDAVFHLAAQPLVRRSYRDPLETLSSNVMGTAHVLDACRTVDSVRAIVVVTTDKCYENKEQVRGYRETDRLGGHDPYSASKAAAEIVTASYRQAFFHYESAPLLASARAGNVIGGGDWSEDRLIPDIVRAMGAEVPLEIRSPKATRPWQHVLEPLAGYMMLGWRLLEGKKDFATAWNFGPDSHSNQNVETVLTCMKKYWPAMTWSQTDTPQPHEASLLHLDSTQAHTLLQWPALWNLEECLEKTAAWYRAHHEENRIITAQQLDDYIATGRAQGAAWVAA